MSHVPEHGLMHPIRECGFPQDRAFPNSSACQFRTGRGALLSALGRALQGGAMVAVGAFLLSRISTAPQLTLQVCILSTLLIVGGSVFTINAIAAMTSHVTVDRDGIRGRLGRSAFDIPWSHVTRWRVSDHDDRLSAVACAEVWTEGTPSLRSLPGGFLDRETRLRFRERCRSIAPEREQG